MVIWTNPYNIKSSMDKLYNSIYYKFNTYIFVNVWKYKTKISNIINLILARFHLVSRFLFA